MNSLKRFFFLPFLVLAVSFSHVLATHEGSPPQWEWRNPLPQGNPLFGVAVGTVSSGDEESSISQEIYVAIGEAGTAISSTDRQEWEVGFLGNNSWYTDITFAGGLFVAVGSEGSIATSSDGRNWTLRRSNTFQWLWSVMSDGGRFIAVGSAGSILTSDDGIEWEVGNMGEGFEDVWLQGIAYNGTNTYVAVCDRGMIYRSFDLELWFEIDDVGAGVSFEDVKFTHRGFIIVGANGFAFESPDGFQWEEIMLPSFQYFWHVSDDGNSIRIVGRNGTMITSTDPDGWQLEYSDTLHFLRATATGNSGWVGVGNAGVVIARVPLDDDDEGSQPETGWRDQSKGSRHWLFDITYAGNTWLAVGEAGRILKYVIDEDNPEEMTWESRVSNTSNWLRAIIQAGPTNRLVTVGHSGTIRYSDDNGEEWVAAESETTRALHAIAYGGPGEGTQQFIAVGANGTILRSVDGSTWEVHEVFDEHEDPFEDPIRVTDNLHTVIHADGYFWAAGQRGRLMRSTSGINWVTIDTPTNLVIYSLAFGEQENEDEEENDKIFVAVGRNGLVLTSSDGEDWTVNTFSPFFDLNSIAFTEGRFVTVGNFGRIYTSLNGIHWTARRSGTHRNLWGTGDGLDEFLVVGEGGSILESLVPSVDDLMTYEVWLDHFELFEPEEREVTASPSGDLVPNLLKFVTAQNPLINTYDELPALQIYRQSGQRFISLIFVEATNVGEVTVNLERSSDLLDWEPIEPVEEIIEFFDEASRRVRWTDPEPLPLPGGFGPDRRFLRLNIELLHPEEE